MSFAPMTSRALPPPCSYAVDRAPGGTIDGEDPFLYVDPRDPTVLHAPSNNRCTLQMGYLHACTRISAHRPHGCVGDVTDEDDQIVGIARAAAG